MSRRELGCTAFSPAARVPLTPCLARRPVAVPADVGLVRMPLVVALSTKVESLGFLVLPRIEMSSLARVLAHVPKNYLEYVTAARYMHALHTGPMDRNEVR